MSLQINCWWKLSFMWFLLNSNFPSRQLHSGWQARTKWHLWKTEEILFSVYLAFSPLVCPIAIVCWLYLIFTTLSLINCGQKILKMYCLDSKYPSIMREDQIAYLLLFFGKSVDTITTKTSINHFILKMYISTIPCLLTVFNKTLHLLGIFLLL